MKLDKETVAKVAHLARLEVDEGGKESLLQDMNRILSFMEKLNELDTQGIEPLIYLSDEINVFRDDVVKTDITRDEALKNAPEHDDQYFKVTKVIDRT